MKCLKKTLMILLIFSMLMVEKELVYAAKKINITRNTSVKVGKTARIVLKNNKKKVVWKIKNARNAKIIKKSKVGCTVKGIKKGNAVVTAIISGKKYNCKIKVIKDEESSPHITSIVYDGTNADEVENSKGLIELVISDKIEEMDNEFFSPIKKDKNRIVSIRISSSVKEIGAEAVTFFQQLEKIVVDSRNKYYDSRENCNAIIKTSADTLLTGCNNTIIPDSVKKIGSYAFYGNAKQMNRINIPGNVLEIGYGAFDGCEKLEEVTISNGVEEILGGAFGRCGIRRIEIPSSVKRIGYACFYGCNNLEEIKVNKGNLYFDSRDNCNAIIATQTNVLVQGCAKTCIPNSVVSIEIKAFFSFDKLTKLELPVSVKNVSERSFYYCRNLEEIHIPISVNQIAEDAFEDCDKLKKIIWNEISYNEFSTFWNAFEKRNDLNE